MLPSLDEELPPSHRRALSLAIRNNKMVALLVATGGADQRHDRRIGHFASASGSGCMGSGWRTARTESRVREVTPINELR